MNYRLTASLLLAFSLNAFSQTSFWSNSVVPANPYENDSSSVTLGLKFYSDVPGVVTGVRFYKGKGNNGTHKGQLWSSSGTKLAEVTFSNETASGWQQAQFSTPITISAKTTYVISYLAPYGHYAFNSYFAWTNVSASPLHVAGSSPGVYTYGSGARFPNSTWHACNYWVDVIFTASTSQPSPSPTFTISGKVGGAPATLTLSGAAGAVTKTDSAGSYQFTNLQNGSYVVAPSQSGYSFSPSSTTVSVAGIDVSGINFTATALPTVSHRVTVSWTASTSANVIGYNVYRATSSGGTYTKINPSLVNATSYVDSTVTAGQTYFYVATAVGSDMTESTYSNNASANVPM